MPDGNEPRLVAIGSLASPTSVEGRIERTQLDGARIFGGVVDDYERGRPTYPDEIVDWLAERCGLEGDALVVDLGAGTGKLTRLLTPKASVVAIDPDPVMLSTLRRQVPEARAICARAEAIPLSAGSVSAVTAAQCFDWFRLNETLLEIHRILHPGGSLGVLFNQLGDVHAVFMEIVARHCGSVRVDAESPWRDALANTALFTSIGEHTTRFAHVVDAERLVSLAASISYIAALPEPQRPRVLADVRALAAQASAEIVVPYTCRGIVLRSTGAGLHG